LVAGTGVSIEPARGTQLEMLERHDWPDAIRLGPVRIGEYANAAGSS